MLFLVSVHSTFTESNSYPLLENKGLFVHCNSSSFYYSYKTIAHQPHQVLEHAIARLNSIIRFISSDLVLGFENF